MAKIVGLIAKDEFERGFTAKTKLISTTTDLLKWLKAKIPWQREKGIEGDAVCRSQSMCMVGGEI